LVKRKTHFPVPKIVERGKANCKPRRVETKGEAGVKKTLDSVYPRKGFCIKKKSRSNRGESDGSEDKKKQYIRDQKIGVKT